GPRRMRVRGRMRQSDRLRRGRVRQRFVRIVRLPRVKPRVAITVGDPAGIGPEIAKRAADADEIRPICEPILYAASNGSHFEPGILSADAGRAAYDIIVRAVADAQSGAVDAIATAPINKAALRQAGLPWNGHTDLLAHLTGSNHVAMMFYS